MRVITYGSYTACYRTWFIFILKLSLSIIFISFKYRYMRETTYGRIENGRTVWHAPLLDFFPCCPPKYQFLLSVSSLLIASLSSGNQRDWACSAYFSSFYHHFHLFYTKKFHVDATLTRDTHMWLTVKMVKCFLRINQRKTLNPR